MARVSPNGEGHGEGGEGQSRISCVLTSEDLASRLAAGKRQQAARSPRKMIARKGSRVIFQQTTCSLDRIQWADLLIEISMLLLTGVWLMSAMLVMGTRALASGK